MNKQEMPEDHCQRGWYARGYVPHFDGGPIPQMVTFRLIDSFPTTCLDEWSVELAAMLPAQRELERRRRIEEYLDKGFGSSWLSRSDIAEIVLRALLCFNGQRYQLHAWTVMPNHVHVLLTVAEEKKIRKELKFQKKRLAKIKKAKKRLERRAKAKARVEAKEKKQLNKQCLKIRKIPDPAKALPAPKDQINFTDPDSRIMGRAGGEFQQCFNTQIVVDSHVQLIVAHDVVQQGNDKKLLQPMLHQVHARLGRHPDAASADAGYFSEQAVQNESLSSIELLVPPDRETHPGTSLPFIGRIPKDISPADRMRRKLSTKRGKAMYAQRKCIVEPVYGQVKHSVLGFEQFSWRGLQNVRSEWALVCAAHNLCKLQRAVSPGLCQFHLTAAA